MRSLSAKLPDVGRVYTVKYPLLVDELPPFPPLIAAFAIAFEPENPAKVKVQPLSTSAV